MTAKRAYKQFHIGFSKEEWEIVCRKAKAARLRNGTYVRRMAVKGEIKYYELKELVTLKRAFLSIGNNLNQIAKVVNESGSVYQKDMKKSLVSLEEQLKTAITEKKAASDFYTAYENQMKSDYQILLGQAKAELENLRREEERQRAERERGEVQEDRKPQSRKKTEFSL